MVQFRRGEIGNARPPQAEHAATLVTPQRADLNTAPLIPVAIERRVTMCLMGYWQDLRRDDRCAAISDYDPDSLRSFRDDCVSFAPAGTDDRWICREIGANLAAASNSVGSPLAVSEIPPNTLLSVFVDLLPVAAASKFASLEDGTYVDRQGDPVAYRAIVLPFVDNAENVAFMVGLARQRKVAPNT